jgi:acyl dehydratase
MAGDFTPSVGDELPPLTKAPDREQLVKYAAGSGDFNPLHYDADFPQAQAIGGNIVHGRMKYAAMGQLVSDWLAHRGWIRRITAQYRGMDGAGATFTCRGRVAEIHDEGDRRIVEIEVWTENDQGETTTTGRAEVVLS